MLPPERSFKKQKTKNRPLNMAKEKPVIIERAIF